MTAQIHDIMFLDGEGYAICGVRGEGLFDPSDHGWIPMGTNTACARGFNCIYGVVDDRLDLGAVNIGGRLISPDDKGPDEGGEREAEEPEGTSSEKAHEREPEPPGRLGPDYEDDLTETFNDELEQVVEAVRSNHGNGGQAPQPIPEAFDLPPEMLEVSSDEDFDIVISMPNPFELSEIPIPSKPSFTGGLLLGSDFIDALYVHMGFKAPYTFEKVIELTFDNGYLIDTIDRSEEMASIRVQRGSDGNGGWRDPELWVEGSFSLDY